MEGFRRELTWAVCDVRYRIPLMVEDVPMGSGPVVGRLAEQWGYRVRAALELQAGGAVWPFGHQVTLSTMFVSGAGR